MENKEIRDVIVTIDFSEESLNALRFAMVFIKKFKANIDLVYVINKKNKYQVIDGKSEHDWAKEQLENIIKKYQVRLKHGKFSYHISKGTISKEVINFSNRKHSFLIITSTSGISGFKEYLLGSNANNIVSDSKCPVITVKDDSCSRNIQKIVVPIDHTENSLQKIPIAAEIAKKHGSEVHLLFIHSSTIAEAKIQLSKHSHHAIKYLNDKKVKYVEHSLKGSNVSELILNYSKSINANLIAIMSEQELSVKNLILGPVAQQVVNVSTIPVLCIHPRDLYVMPGLHASM